MKSHIKLFTPGPGDVDDDILDALRLPVMRHYGPDWMPVHVEMDELLHKLFKTANDMFVVPGPASAVLDMAIGSAVAPGRKIIIGTNGFFGDRLLEISRAHHLDIIPFMAAWGQPLDPEVLLSLIKENPDAVAFAMVHHETSTTVLNPLKKLMEIASQAGLLTIVDTVSSLGGVDVPVDDWGIDLCVCGANKCIEAAPGVAFISVSPRAWQMVDSHSGSGSWYLDLKLWRHYIQEWGAWHPSPVTLPSNVILAAREGIKKIFERGLDAHYARYARACKAMRTGMTNLGFEMFVPENFASPIATAVKARPEFSIDEMTRWLMDEHQIAIGAGLGELSGKIFRVGHLGKAAERDYMLDFLFTMEEYLRFKKIPVQAGSGVAGLFV
ncbi:MAG: alanine--glyoxylate aminotransferase family protein [Leptolinea sp.]|nr:alanine--glyoxylate aminotransferase family protein [Leptolinea sp.]